MTAQVASLELSHALAIELHGLFRALEHRLQAPEVVREKLEAASRALDELLASEWSLIPAAVAESLERVAELLRRWMHDDTQAWAELKAQLREAYASLSTALRSEQVVVPELRPANYTRSLVHMVGAVVSLGLIIVLSATQLAWVAGGFGLFAWSLEASRTISPQANARMMKLFGPIAHEQEWDRVNSATWYSTALALLGLTFSPLLCAIAVAVLGFADPMAGLLGRRWGRIRLVNNRSLEGTLTFVVVGTLAARAAMSLVGTTIDGGSLWIVALASAIAGALAELFSRRVDDNFSIPTVVAGTAMAMLLLLGLSPWG